MNYAASISARMADLPSRAALACCAGVTRTVSVMDSACPSGSGFGPERPGRPPLPGTPAMSGRAAFKQLDLANAQGRQVTDVAGDAKVNVATFVGRTRGNLVRKRVSAAFVDRCVEQVASGEGRTRSSLVIGHSGKQHVETVVAGSGGVDHGHAPVEGRLARAAVAEVGAKVARADNPTRAVQAGCGADDLASGAVDDVVGGHVAVSVSMFQRVPVKHAGVKRVPPSFRTIPEAA